MQTLNLIVKKLRCEYKKNPIGIDVTKPRLSWIIESNERATLQYAYQIQVVYVEDNESNLMWDTGKTISDNSNQIEYEGLPLQSMVRYYYRVRVWNQNGEISNWSEPDYWEMGLLKKEEWVAKWITPTKGYETKEFDPCPYFRRCFVIKDKVKSARIYATCLGLYQLYLNGNKISIDLFTPGWTSYKKRVLYQTYDITNMLFSGKNAIGAVLGNGWYKGNLFTFLDTIPPIQNNFYGKELELFVQLHIKYENGKEEIIVTDNKWKYAYGPILMADIYNGEIYDARLEMPGWSTPAFDDNNWKDTKVTDTIVQLAAQESLPARIVKELMPQEILKSPSGETLIDMGQNMVGGVRFSVTGKAGDKVILQHGEVLDKEGNLYTKNLRSAKQMIEFTLNGKGKEEFEPHFTYQGFRYIKVVSAPMEPSLMDFVGIVISSDLEQTSQFYCSNPLINQLQSNIIWSQIGNFLSIPTDCPQRDERLGWTGDAQVFIPTACFNMNTALFYSSWLKDLQLDQNRNGAVPLVVPNTNINFKEGVAGWGDAATICPWVLYTTYRDKRILEDQYDSMKAWVNYILSQTDHTFLWNTGKQIGDWLSLNGKTPDDYIATAYFAYSTEIVVKVAKVLEQNVDVSLYSQLYRNIVSAFRKEFVTPNGKIAVPTQTAHVIALAFHLVEEKHIQRTVDALVALINENNNHLTTGFLGTPDLCNVLSQYGYNDVAYKLIQQITYPSWLYEITKGATTIWERWDSIKEDGTICCPIMNSFNHYAFGAVGNWMYQVLGGIRVDENNPGYKHIIIKPQIGPDIDYAGAIYESQYGRIRCDWERKDEKIFVHIIIPVNTTASVYLPFARTEKLLEKGVNIYEMKEIFGYQYDKDELIIETGSGEYEFIYEVK